MCTGSVKLSADQTTIVYPPAEQDRCDTPCVYCEMAAHTATLLCPTCQQPLGYGAILPLQRSHVFTYRLAGNRELVVYSRPWAMIPEHYACWEQRQAEKLTEDAARRTEQPIDPNDTFDPTETFYQVLLASPSNQLVSLYLYSDLVPAGVNRDDPRLLDWRNRQLQPVQSVAPGMPPKQSGRKARKVKDIA